MKKAILCIAIVFWVGNCFAYTYVVETYQSLPDLYGTESMLITGQGGGIYTGLFNDSSLTVESTSTPLGQGTGGIWQIQIGHASSLTMSGGQVHLITINNDATAFLTGGHIDGIYSYQHAWVYDDSDPPVLVPNPHIMIECSDHFYNENTNILTGHWLDDGLAFSIQLIDVDGYSPAIENIQFIPEPATLSLLGLGGLLIRRKRK